MLQVQVGDTIRAYDFKPMVGREDCFIEGVVLDRNNTEHGYQAYKIRVTKSVYNGERDEIRLNEEMVVPWRVSFMEYEGRIMNLSR